LITVRLSAEKGSTMPRSLLLALVIFFGGCAKQEDHQEKMALVVKPSESESKTNKSEKLKVWKTIELGVFQSTNAYLKVLHTADVKIGYHASKILKKQEFTVASQKREVKLVKLTLPELGFPNGALLEEIYARAKELGLDVCPAEVGPALRLAYKDQPNGEWLLIAMEPISDSGVGGGPPDRIVLEIGHVGGSLWLDNRYFRPVLLLPADHWVFVCK